jgi:hypothetical protein
MHEPIRLKQTVDLAGFEVHVYIQVSRRSCQPSEDCTSEEINRACSPVGKCPVFGEGETYLGGRVSFEYQQQGHLVISQQGIAGKT